MRSVLGLVHGAGDVVLRAETVNNLNVLGQQLEVKAIQVALDARRRQALGEDNIASGGVPVQQDLGWSPVVLLGNGSNSGIFQFIATG